MNFILLMNILIFVLKNEPELVIRQKNMKTKNLNSGAMFVSKGHTATGCADLRGLNCHLGQW